MKNPNQKMAALVVVTFIAGAAYAHQGATGIVKQRMMAMGALADSMKTVSMMLRGKTEFDPVAVESAMASMIAHAETLPQQFPKGSDAAPSEAGPKI